MGTFEVILLVTVALFCFAFALRFAVNLWKFIYRLAPMAVPFFILVAMYLYMNVNMQPETEVKDANHIESIEDQSGRSGY